MLRVLFAGTWTAVRPEAALRWLVLLPLLGALLNATLGRWLERRPWGRPWVAALGVASVSLAAVLAVWLVLGPLRALPPEARRLFDPVASFLTLGSVNADLALLLDPLSAVMILVITLVGALIHLFAAGYMHDEPATGRFFSLLNGFVAAMLLLVLGDGFVSLFLGWEGVGLCSALLIGFWWREPANARAASKAFVVNRVGDTGLLFAMALLFWSLGGTFAPSPSAPGRPAFEGTGRTGVALADPADLSRIDTSPGMMAGPSFAFRELVDVLALRQLEHRLPGRRPFSDGLLKKKLWGVPVLWLVCLGLFVAACGKSAQLPLAIWLPDAMAGPTPVSALIHAATMVTAGVYLLARTSFLFALVPAFGLVVAVVAASTALLAALAAAVQHDLKRVLAFSTISQLGFMFLALGAGAPAVALLHVVTHACFKACLFLAAGAVIHALAELGPAPAVDRALTFRRGYDPTNPQDMRNMGGLARRLPLVRVAYFVACWAIAGLPPAAGFFSKDAIMEALFEERHLGAWGPFLGASALATAALTAFYMFRSYYLVFEARPAPRNPVAHLHAPSWSMATVLVVLAAASLGIGALLGWPAAFHPSGSEPYLVRWLGPVWEQAQGRLGEAAAHQAVELPRRLAFDFMGMGVAVAVAGWYFARLFFKNEARSRPLRERLQGRFEGAHATVFAFFRVDELLRAVVVEPVRNLSAGAARLDAGLVDGFVNEVARTARAVAAAGAAFDHWFVDGAVNGVAQVLSRAGRRLSRLQSGRLHDYLLASVLGLLALSVALVLAFLGSR